jgi:NAD+ diphosphatase
MNDSVFVSAARPARGELSARTGFADHLFDRGAELREKPAALAGLRAAHASRFAVTAGDKPVLARRGDAFSVWHDAASIAAMGAVEEEIWLGRDEAGHGRFGVRLPTDRAEELKGRDGMIVLDLRSLAVQGLVPAGELGAVATAKAMTDWHARHRFCAQCGQPTQSASGGWKRECPSCAAQHFPRTDPVAIMLIVRDDRCLLARQSRFAPGMHSCIAGFIEPGETLEDAVRRETLEEAGLVVGEVRYLCSQPWAFPSSLMIGCIGTSLTEEITLDGEELEAGRWFTRDEVRLMLKGEHPDGLGAPVPIAIAHTLLRSWAEG